MAMELGLMYLQEEDFVTQLYNRNLLSAFSDQEISALLQDALCWIGKTKDNIPATIRAAIIDRLAFRTVFLAALANDTQSFTDRSSHLWDECAEFHARMKETQTIGRPVPESFSIKIQRRLASTVPPRPLVHLGFDPALDCLRRLCQDSKDIQSVLEYKGSNDLMVRGLPT